MPLAVAFAVSLLALDQSAARMVVCIGLLLVVETTDALDGFLARRLGRATRTGAMLDPYADSFSRLTVYWALACGGLVLPFVPLIMALRDVTVAYSRIVLAGCGRSVSANISGKIKAIVQSVGALAATLGPLYWQVLGKWPIVAISWTVAIVTAASAVEYVHAARRSIRSDDAAPERP